AFLAEREISHFYQARQRRPWAAAQWNRRENSGQRRNRRGVANQNGPGHAMWKADGRATCGPGKKRRLRETKRREFEARSITSPRPPNRPRPPPNHAGGAEGATVLKVKGRRDG